MASSSAEFDFLFDAFYKISGLASTPPWFEEKTDAELYDLLLDEIENGLDGTGIRPGVVKPRTSLNTVTPDEERSIRLAARAHLETGITASASG